jgi:ADP-ribose pyrophosphatase
MVLKIDHEGQMRHELAGYYRVKDFMGKHVPTFGLPVTRSGQVGVGMELAAMEGTPETLQDLFEEADSDQATQDFLRRLQKALEVLSDRLYANTSREEWIIPYREFGLHHEEQVIWLGENAEDILGQARREGVADVSVDVQQLQKILKLVTRNENGVNSRIALAHGDLNYQNIISDSARNLWFIDWTHAGETPVELDFAKLENDVKYVMSKDFSADDVQRLRQFEEYLLVRPMPAAPNELPDSLRFVKWDLRYRKILESVRMIREACLGLSEADGWLIYRIALLRYATHTLSFAEWRDRGECGVVALLHALHAAENLLFQLVSDDFHMRIRAQRPESYPPRQIISIDEAAWMVDCGHYNPPYHVAAEVLENAGSKQERRWAQPEEASSWSEIADSGRSSATDAIGRPLNPRGRTGISGRGLLGRWGRNPAVAVIVLRAATDHSGLEILVGKRESSLGASLPRGFLFLGEDAEPALHRILQEKAALRVESGDLTKVYDDYLYDARQTDHSWVELQAFVIGPEARVVPVQQGPTDAFDELDWWPFTKETLDRLDSADAQVVEAAQAMVRDTDERYLPG